RQRNGSAADDTLELQKQWLEMSDTLPRPQSSVVLCGAVLRLVDYRRHLLRSVSATRRAAALQVAIAFRIDRDRLGRVAEPSLRHRPHDATPPGAASCLFRIPPRRQNPVDEIAAQNVAAVARVLHLKAASSRFTKRRLSHARTGLDIVERIKHV